MWATASLASASDLERPSPVISIPCLLGSWFRFSLEYFRKEGWLNINSELIEMPFWMLSWVNSGNHVLDGVADPPSKRAILGERVAHCKI